MTTYYIHIGNDKRAMTPDEVADYEDLVQEVADQQASKTAAQQSARNKLKNLGLTDNEITALGI